MAKETAKATEEIECRIESIQADTHVAVGAIEDIPLPKSYPAMRLPYKS